MAIKKITITDFIDQASAHPVIDVRSPGEFEHAHFPGAHNIPLFTDEERKEVGTAYKQQGKQKAIKIGLDYFGPKMKKMVEDAEAIFDQNKLETKTILVHCWRGGMRSAGVAWLLDLYGYEVYTLIGGYKSYRHFALKQMELPYRFNVLGGYTGSAKTEMLHFIQTTTHAVIDLEGIANHKGSAFGAIGLRAQPSQEMFENMLALQLYQHNHQNIWIEDESQRIGNLNIPHPLWKTIRSSPLYFIDIPFERRLQFIIQQYGQLDKISLMEATQRIERRLGPNETKIIVQYLMEDKINEAFLLLLQYYDKTYTTALNKREGLAELMHSISLNSVNPEENAQSLLAEIKK
jgi:tRNA 2-selenouridine synthase